MTVVQGSGAPARPERAGGDGRWPTAHELMAFASLAETLHFGQTAAMMGLAQSSLSEAIRRLETKLNAVLLERTSRRVALTDAGVRLLPVARTILRGLEAARTVSDPAPKGTGVLRVGVEGGGLAELNRPVFAALETQRPRIRLVVRESLGLPQVFLDQHLDLALVRTPATDPLVVHPVALEERGLLLPPDHPLASAKSLSMSDVLDEPFVAVAPRMAPGTCDHWLAVAQRQGREAVVGGAAYSAQEVVQAVGHLGLLSTGWCSLLRAHPLPEAVFVPATDLPPTTIGVAVKRDEERPEILDVVDLVRAVVANRADLAPGIIPLR